MSFWQRQQDRASEFGGKANAIIDIIETPCEDKWSVLITTALPAAGDSMIMLITPQPSEILEEYLEPKGRRGASRRAPRKGPRNRNTRSGTRRPWARPRLPYFDAWFAEKLPGADYFHGRDVGRKEKWFWKGLNMADRLLWWWLIIDATENFVVNWHSGLMHSRFCSRAWDLIGELSFTRQGTNEGFPTPLWEVDGLDIHKEKGLAFGDTGTTNHVPNDTPHTATYIIEAKGKLDDNNGFNKWNTEAWFEITVTDFDHQETTSQTDPQLFAGSGDWTLRAEITVTNKNTVKILMKEERNVSDEGPGPFLKHKSSTLDVIGEYNP